MSKWKERTTDMAALRKKEKEGWWSLAGKPTHQREVEESSDDNEEEEGQFDGEEAAGVVHNRVTHGRAHFCCGDYLLDVQGDFYVLNPAYEYCFYGLYKNNTSVEGFYVFDTEKLEYRPKPFSAALFRELLQDRYSGPEIAQLQAWIQQGNASAWGLSYWKQALLNKEREPEEEEFRTLLHTVRADLAVVRYFWFQELDRLQYYYSKSTREYLLHNVLIQDILKLHAMFVTGHKLERLCFHATKAKLGDGLGKKLRRLPELNYGGFMKAQLNVSKKASPEIVNAVSIYHEILRISTYGHKQSDLFSGSKKLLYKPPNHGHLYTDYGTVQRTCRNNDCCEASLLWLLKKGATAEPPLKLEDLSQIGTKRHIYLSSVWNTQQRLIEQIRGITKRWKKEGGEEGMTLRTGDYQLHSSRELNALQTAAVEAAITHPISIITGRGGTGKTEAVKDVVERYGNDDPDENRVMFVGPTGRSAVNASKRVMQGYTMDKVAHTLLKAMHLKLEAVKQEEEEPEPTYSPTAWDWYLHMSPEEHRSLLKKRRMMEFVTLARRWKNTEVLLIDEMSMVDLEKLEFLLRVLTQCAPLKKLVLLGDVQQLQSIGAGRVMADFIKAFPDAVTRLRTNMRNPSSTIFHNAEVCMRPSNHKLGKQLRYDSSFQLLHYDAKRGQSSVQREVDRLFSQLKTEKSFEPKDVHFIAFRRAEVAGFNKACRRHFTDHYVSRTDGKGDRPEFFVGERIYFKKNNYTQGVMNGQIWTILRYVDVMRNGSIREDAISNLDMMRSGTVTRVVVLRSEDEETVLSIDLQDLPLNYKNVNLGYATTIHKFQGTEKKVIGYRVEDHWLENASHFYTGTTRSTSSIYLIGTNEAVNNTIRRPVPMRRSQLASLLQQAMEHLSDDDDDEMDGNDRKSSSSSSSSSNSIEKGEEKPRIKRQKTEC